MTPAELSQLFTAPSRCPNIACIGGWVYLNPDSNTVTRCHECDPATFGPRWPLHPPTEDTTP